MHDSILEYQLELIKIHEPFVIATVVRREAPSSGKTGDKAIINKFGEISGWVGGGCVKGIVIKEAQDALRTGKGRLVKIGKTIQSSKQEGIMEYKMTCQSEGSVEVFIEPVLPKTHLVVIGKTAIGFELVKLATAMAYRVTFVGQEPEGKVFENSGELEIESNLENVKTSPNSFFVIATQGEGDEKVLTEALKKGNAYLGFVASRKKMAALKKYLLDEGFDEKAIEGIRSPAGIDIKARQPEEVAISILAEIIMVRNEQLSNGSFEKKMMGENETRKSPEYYINPVCGIPIDKDNSKYVLEYKNEKVYFCCDGCKEKFEKDPEKYMKARALGLEPEGM